MAYLPGFEYDIFISYAHVDNLPYADEKPWVEQFHEKLEIELARRIGRVGVVKIWRDKKLEGDQLFDQTIRTGIDTAALFLALTSHGYLASEYCQQELRAFYSKAKAEPYGLQIEDRSRLYALLLNNIPYEQWPAEYGRITGYPFHDAEAADDLGMPTAHTDPTLKRQIRALADSVYKMLQAFQAAASQTSDAEPTPESAPDAPRVFLADVSDTLRQTRTRVLNELERKGIPVTGDTPPPYEAAAHEEQVTAALNQVELSVHLLDAYAGRAVDGDPGISYPQKQLSLAKDLVRPQIIWVPKNLDLAAVEEENHKIFLEQLEHGERGNAKYDFIRGVSCELSTHIVDKLEQLEAARATSTEAQRTILLDTHLKDQLYALELSRSLIAHNIQPYINPQEDDPNKNMEAFEARLKEVSALMIIFGAVNETWVRQRLGSALQLSVVQNLSITSFSVFVAPPHKKEETLNFNLGPIQVPLIDNTQSPQIDESALAQIVHMVQAGGAV